MPKIASFMSKRKPTKRKNPQPKKTVKKAKPAPPPVAPVVEDAPGLKRIFWIAFAVMGLIMILASFKSGINGDDLFQNDYSEKLVNYYSTFGKDKAALNIPDGNMHYYGGFFDIVTGFVNKALGFAENEMAYHQVRHFFNALMGMLALLFTGLLAREIGGWRAAILALILLFLSPRFFGHSLMNPKDIPFAAGNVMAIYYLLRWLKSMPTPHWKDALGLAAGIGLAISTRAGGLLLIGYVGLFAAFSFVLRYQLKGLAQQPKLLGKYILWGGGASIAGYLLAVLFWPFALANPIAHPLEALTEFSSLGIKIRVLFQA